MVAIYDIHSYHFSVFNFCEVVHEYGFLMHEGK